MDFVPYIDLEQIPQIKEDVSVLKTLVEEGLKENSEDKFFQMFRVLLEKVESCLKNASSLNLSQEVDLMAYMALLENLVDELEGYEDEEFSDEFEEDSAELDEK